MHGRTWPSWSSSCKYGNTFGAFSLLFLPQPAVPLPSFQRVPPAPPRPTSFFIPNIFNGIVWFILPAMLIIVNDIFAYLAGEGVKGDEGVHHREGAQSLAGSRALLRFMIARCLLA